MLKELRIQNLAIIDSLTVNFQKGMNVLSGETGAGKSIIVDALGLALGDRAQSDLIKSGVKEAVVQAYFELDDYSFLPDIGIDLSEGLFLRRVLSAGGKSRAYINDSMVTIQTLSEVGKLLVDIQSQHEHQSLLTAEKQRTLLDSYGRLQEDRKKVEALFGEMQSLQREHDALRSRRKDRAKQIDMLTFQINEINAAALKPQEKEELLEEKTLLGNASKLNELAEMSYALLYDAEGSCTEKLSRVVASLREMLAFDKSIEDTLVMLEAAKPLVEDAAFSLRGYREKYECEPGRLEVVEERLDLIQRLEKKYGEGIENILRYSTEASEELKGLETSDDRLLSVEKELAFKGKELLETAEVLSGRRKKSARKIKDLIEETLRDLAFGNARFSIAVTQEKGENGTYKINATGIDRIEFLFSANPGEALKPLAKIISGGELSRVMLALKSMLADVDSIPVLIFDEVDAGIGGKTAENVGRKLEVISKKHQILCITHLPQVASFGDFHLKIEKTEQDNRVQVKVKELAGKERKDEIARMLSGKITDISLKHAGELLERVK